MKNNQYLYDNLAFLEESLESKSKELRKLIANRGRADDLGIGNIIITIGHCESEIKRLTAERDEAIIAIETVEKNKTNATLMVYILASTEEQIQTTITKHYKILKKKGYKPKSKADYAPFERHPPISKILEELKHRYSYEFNIKYLDYNLLEDDYFQLVHSLPSSILIADICSFCNENKHLAKHFDTHQSGTIITTPSIASQEIEDFLKIQVEIVFRYGTIARKKAPVHNFFPSVRERYDFECKFNSLYQRLQPALKNKTHFFKKPPNPSDDIE